MKKIIFFISMMIVIILSSCNNVEYKREYAKALDDISNRQRSVTIHSKKTELAIVKLEGQLINLNLTTKERQLIVDEMNALTLKQFKSEENLVDQRLNAEKDRLETKHKLSDQEIETLMNYVKNYEEFTKLEHDAVQDAVKDLAKYEAAQKLHHTINETTLGAEIASIVLKKRVAKEATLENLEDKRKIWEETKKNLSEQQLAYMAIQQAIEVYAKYRRAEVTRYKITERKKAWEDTKKNLSEQELAYVMLGQTINKVADAERDQIANVLNDWIDVQLKLQKFRMKIN